MKNSHCAGSPDMEWPKTAISSKHFSRWNENAPSCKESITKWSQVPCRYPITWAAKTAKTQSISFLVSSCSLLLACEQRFKQNAHGPQAI